MSGLLQLGVLRSRFFQNWDICVRVFPKRQKILKKGARFDRPQLFLSHHLTSALQKDSQDVKRLLLQLNPLSLPPQFPRAQIRLKGSKPQDGGRLGVRGHGCKPIGALAEV